MIILFLGNVGSGKTACAVRHMVLNNHMNYYSNILPTKPKLTPNIITIQPEMIVENKIVDYKKSGEAITKLDLNKDYWVNDAKKPLSVVLDEAHDFMDARRSMTKVNQILAKFLALARRIVGETDAEGDLIFITQLDRRIDVICREMAHQIRYHICHYFKSCKKCGCSWRETSETPEKAMLCFYCGSHLLEKNNFCIEVMHFANIQVYDAWKEFGMKSYHRHYFIRDIEQFFPYYNTLQWNNMFEDLY